ncbi:hypothetical protein DF196_08760 [Bifidobacterium callitrichidarum]|uniref:Uncharacterized protein n=1 Tax=Bifidobacterium callitrichidarum TaxID=2052941 RepID=A0A2U2N5V5_9BIFI|nr:hypothetical protein DF196_08760 [Bifidobacterium callitrichidarum]
MASASAVRITYTTVFKRQCLTSYYQGGSPVDLFRKAGLPPELIGYKRIERCFSRWRESAAEIFSGEVPLSEVKSARGKVRGRRMVSGAASDKSVLAPLPARDWSAGSAGRSARFAVHADDAEPLQTADTSSADSTAPAASAASDGDDLRDQLIRQQVRYIIQLEQEIDELKKRGNNTDHND